MTNTTTDDALRLRRIRRTAWALAVLLYGGAAAVFVLNEDLHRRTLWLDRGEADEQAAEVKARARRREARVKRKREEIRLPERDAQELREREEDRRRELALDRLERMEEAYERIKQTEQKNLDVLREQTLERFRERERNDFRLRTHRLRESAERLEQELRESTDTEAVPEEMERLMTETANARREAPTTGEIVEQPEVREQLLDSARRVEQAVEDLARVAETRPEVFSERAADRLENLKQDAERFRKLAEEMRALPGEAQEVADYLAETPDPVDDAEVTEQLADKQRLSTDELYDTAVELEKKSAQRVENARAAELAALQERTFREARERLADLGEPSRPDLGEQLRKSDIRDVGDLNEFRDTLDRTVSEMENMSARARNRARQLDPEENSGHADEAAPGLDLATREMERKQRLGHVAHQQNARSLDLTGLMRTPGGGASAQTGEVRPLPEQQLSEETVVTRALPGRRFTDEAFRKGWLYIDTWYIIGPWDLIPDTHQPLPPEVEIDLDAVYTNGKTGRPRHARTRERMELDGTLKWQFVQSDKLFVRPPKETGDAIYFAYTELYFDRERDILVAIGIDDQSKVWINDQVIWNHRVQSWRLGTSLRKVTFRKGINTVLIRMENGAPLMDFSLVLCPPEALPGEG